MTKQTKTDGMNKDYLGLETMFKTLPNVFQRGTRQHVSQQFAAIFLAEQQDDERDVPGVVHD